MALPILNIDRVRDAPPDRIATLYMRRDEIDVQFDPPSFESAIAIL